MGLRALRISQLDQTHNITFSDRSPGDTGVSVRVAVVTRDGLLSTATTYYLYHKLCVRVSCVHEYCVCVCAVCVCAVCVCVCVCGKGCLQTF